MMNYADLIQDATSSIGTGVITVTGAAIAQRRPLSTFANGTTGVLLKISGQTGGEWEIASCTILSPIQFSRDTIIIGSNGTSPVNFSAGIKDVVCTLPAEEIAKIIQTDAPTTATIAASSTSKLIMVESGVAKQITVDNFLNSTKINFADAEVPTGAVPGSVFTLAHTPNPPASLMLGYDTQLLLAGVDYTLTGNSITLVTARAVGDYLYAWYRW